MANVITPHFTNYPLLTHKYSDYIIFTEIVKLMLNKDHRNTEGIQKIVNFKGAMNWGLSSELKKAFPNSVIAIKEYMYKSNLILPGEWLAGFSTGESKFFITIIKSKTELGISTWLRFSIAQDIRDLILLESFVKYFGCGYVHKYNNRLVCEFIVTKIDDIINHIIPFSFFLLFFLDFLLKMLQEKVQKKQ